MRRNLLSLFPVRIVVVCFATALLSAARAEAVAQESTTPSTAVDQAAGADLAQIRQLSAAGQHEEALAKLRELKTKNPNLAGLDREFGVLYYRQGNYLEAVNFLKKAVDANPHDSEATQLLGLSYYLGGHLAESIPYLEKVQSWLPRANIDATYILGICYLQSKDYPKARTAFARMFEVPPDSAAAYLLTARMLLRQEFDPVAEEYGLKAAALDPKMPGAHLLLGELYLYKSRIPEAIEQLQKEMSLSPANAAVYYKLADAYSRVEKYDDAERLLQRSIWLDATSTGPYILMGKVLAKKGELELAVRALQRAAAMDPNNPMTHHLLGQTYRDMGRKAEAESELKIAEQLRTKQDAR